MSLQGVEMTNKPEKYTVTQNVYVDGALAHHVGQAVDEATKKRITALDGYKDAVVGYDTKAAKEARGESRTEPTPQVVEPNVPPTDKRP